MVEAGKAKVGNGQNTYVSIRAVSEPEYILWLNISMPAIRLGGLAWLWLAVAWLQGAFVCVVIAVISWRFVDNTEALGHAFTLLRYPQSVPFVSGRVRKHGPVLPKIGVGPWEEEVVAVLVLECS